MKFEEASIYRTSTGEDMRHTTGVIYITSVSTVPELVRNLMAHGDAREGK